MPKERTSESGFFPPFIEWGGGNHFFWVFKCIAPNKNKVFNYIIKSEQVFLRENNTVVLKDARVVV